MHTQIQQKMDFDDLRETIDNFAGKPIKAAINNAGRSYQFADLEPSVSFNPDNCGVSINHSFQPQAVSRSRFHDDEDIAVRFSRDEFKSAVKFISAESVSLLIMTKTFSYLLSVASELTGGCRTIEMTRGETATAQRQGNQKPLIRKSLFRPHVH